MNTNKNYKSFQGKGHIEKEACPLYRLLEHAYEKWNLYELNKEHLSQRNYQSQLGLLSLSYVKAEDQGN